MVKSLNLKAAIGGATCCMLTALPAAAQNTANNQLLGSGLQETFSVSDVAAIMGEYAIQTALEPYEGDETATIAATTEGGARFWISLFQCDDPTTGAACAGAAMFTGLSNAGVSYDDINAFHSEANVTRAVNMSEQNIIIFGTQIFFSGGVGRENLKFVTALFLSDMQRYVDGAAPAAAATVSLNTQPSRGGKVDNVVGADESVSRPEAATVSFKVDRALSAAIGNTWNVRFAPESD